MGAGTNGAEAFPSRAAGGRALSSLPSPHTTFRTPVPTSMSSRSSLVLGGTCALVAAALTIVANVLHPHPLPATTEGVLSLIAGHHHWPRVHAVGIVGGLALVGALVLLADTIRGGAAGALARLGRTMAHVGAPLMIAGAAIDGIAQKAVANAWAKAPLAERALAARAAEGVLYIDAALFYAWVGTLLGVAFVCYGAAIVVGRAYPRALGWLAVAGGVGCILAQGLHVAGIAAPLAPVFPIVSGLDQLFLLLVGVTMLRRARRGAAAASETAVLARAA